VNVPVLRKDFTIAPEHILEAAAHGADAILLIAAILTERELRDFREAAARWKMAALVEVHNRRELDTAVAAGSDIIGVNNRDLTTFEVTLETSLSLAPHMPAGTLLISESGIHSAADIGRLRDAGYSAFLVGEHLMRSGDPAAALRELVAVSYTHLDVYKRQAGNRGHQRNRIAFRRRCRCLAQVAYVFVVQIHVDEAAQLAFIGENLLAQVGEAAGQRVQRFTHGSTGNGDGVLFGGELPQRRGDQNLRHVSTATPLLRLRSGRS